MDISIKGEAGPASECFCYDCGQLRLSLIADKSKCYGCGSTNIKTGKVGELDKQFLKETTMNFSAVEQANGNDVTINAIATALGNTEYTKQKGTPFMKCKLTDANGRMEDVTIWQGKGHPIPGSMQGQTLSFNLSCKVNGQYTNYGGFWNASAQTQPIQPQAQPQGQQAPPQPAQGQQQPAQRPNTPRPKLRDYDAENRGKCRYGIICAYISVGVDPVIPTIDYWVEYAMTGQVPLPPAKQQVGDLLGQPPVGQQWEH